MINPLTLIGARTLAITGAVVVLLLGSTYGLGYWKGSRARAAASATVVESAGERLERERKVSVSNIYADEDAVEKRLTLPEILLPDGSRETTTKITRRVATVQTTDTEAKVEVVYKDRVVTKEVSVPCRDALVSPFPSPAAPQPRWTAGPLVGRNFQLDKTVFGGAVGVRLGPVWFRISGDSDPSASFGAEVQF